MIEESARILSIEGKQLHVQAQPSSACGGCQARSACGQGLLSKYFNQTPGQIIIENRLPSGESIQLKVGDEIIMGIEEGAVLSGAFYAYFVPLLFVLVFVFLAHLTGLHQEWQQILMSLFGLALGTAFVKYRVNQQQAHLKHMLPILLRKVTAAAVNKIPVNQMH